MKLDNQHFEELAHFIRTHRSNEGHFNILYDRLMKEYNAVKASADQQQRCYAENMNEIIQKHAAVYIQNREKGISTYAEFEHVVNSFEKIVTDALHQS